MATVQTADGATVKTGDRVFNYYDCEWGVIGTIHADGWFYFRGESDDHHRLLNGERVAIRKPSWVK